MFKFKKTAVSIGIGLSIGLVVTVGVFLLKASIHGKFPPGTTISGIDVSYKTPHEATSILEKARKDYITAELEITLEGKTVKLTPEELGVDILVDETIQVIKETDATKVSILELFSHKNQDPTSINVLTKIDHEKLIATVEKTFELSDIAPKEASLYVENGEILIEEGETGKVLKENEMIATLKESAKQLVPEKISVELEEIEPEITKEMLEEQIPEIQEALEYEFALLDPIYSDDWYIRLIDYMDWVTFVEKEEVSLENLLTGESEKKIVIEINQEALNIFIDEEISKWLDKPPDPVNIYFDENKEVVVEGKGNNGLEIQRANLKKAIELAVENRIAQVPIPVLEIEPEINISEELQELGIVERIGTGHSSYYGSPANRVHNIKVAAEEHNGTLVAPGEEFSFNNNLGAVDGTTGYRKELVIKPEGTIPEYGGGVCQVSTTMFRAILLSGLPVTERHEHSYAVSYYSQVMGHGMDATIYLGGADLKFMNDTENHILIQAYTQDDYELYFVFYGTDDGRTVEMDGPYTSNYHGSGPTIYVETDKLAEGATKQVEKAHTGFNVLWYRYVTKADGEVITEEIKTNYSATSAKILVGTRKE
ncbi:MAG: VanW family protein [Nitrospirota bacterium]